MLALAPAAIANEHFSVSASSRQLEEKCGVARRNVQRALDSLSKRRLIVVRAGTPTKPAAIWLMFMETVVMGGGVTATPPLPLGGVIATPPWRHSDATGGATATPGTGVTATPPPIENEGLPRTGPPVDLIDIDSDVIDRLLKARPSHFDQARKTAARGMLHSYAVKFGREPERFPPDEAIVAQFLSIADWRRLEGLIYDLMAERQTPGETYAWFITVAMQRIHGFAPAKYRELRDQKKRGLKIVAPPLVEVSPPVQPEQLELTAEADPLEADPPAASAVAIALTDEQLAELDRDRVKRRMAGGLA